MEMVPANISCFGFSPYKNIFFVLIPAANIEYLVLVLDILF